jgi:hypothetical protein
MRVGIDIEEGEPDRFSAAVKIFVGLHEDLFLHQPRVVFKCSRKLGRYGLLGARVAAGPGAYQQQELPASFQKNILACPSHQNDGF